MVAVYIDPVGDVRSRGSGRVIAPAGTTPREARVIAALWAAAADALTNSATAGSDHRSEGMPAVAGPTPTTAAPSHASSQDAHPVAVIDVARLRAETVAALNSLNSEQDSSCR